MKKLALAVLVLLGLVLTSCTDADVASANLSKEADNFRINRRIVFYNGITGEYILSIEGFCSLGNFDAGKELTVTCKTGEDSYKKHFLGLSDNVTYFSEQMESQGVSTSHYKVMFKPSVIVPDFEGD